MQDINMTAKSIGFDHTETIPIDQIAKRVMSGEIIVVSNCLQGIGYFDRVQAASLEAIHQAVSEAKTAQVRTQGFEAIHQIIDLEELPSVSDHSYETIYSLAPELSKELVKGIFPKQKSFYLEEYPNVRFHIPYDIVVNNKEEFSKFYWNGKVTPHGPHHDSWYQCPTNCLNVWIAIGSVKIGNGLNIYPQVYGKRLPCTKDGKILPNQSFGGAISFDLQPGDAIIFHGEHLHSSEINSTDLTRYVISMRMTLDKPEFLSDSPYKDTYIYSECHDGLNARFTQLLGGMSRSFSRLQKRINSALGKQPQQNYILSEVDGSVFDDTSPNFPQTIPVKTVEGASPDDTFIVFDSEELPIGTIKPISPKMCVARLNQNQVVAFSRHCPHEGADLAAGYLRDECVVCPWHNLPLNVNSGASPCDSLSKLTIFNCVEDSNKVEVHRHD